MKLVAKTREGATVKKRYDTAKTPYQRLLASDIPAKAKKALTSTYLSLNPVELKKEIGRRQDKLVKLAGNKSKPALRSRGPTPSIGDRRKRPA